MHYGHCTFCMKNYMYTVYTVHALYQMHLSITPLYIIILASMCIDSMLINMHRVNYVISPHRQLVRMVARVYKRERESILSPVSRLSLSSSACANIYNIFVSVEKERESLGMRLEYPSTYTAVQTCCGWLKALCHAIRADCPLMNLHAHM